MPGFAARAIRLTAGLFALAFAQACFAQAGPTRIGILIHGSSEKDVGQRQIELFKARLAELGYAEGRTLQVVTLRSGGDLFKLRRFAADLVREKPNAIFAPTSLEAIALKDATASIPVVFSGVNDPVTIRLVQSYARPGGNMTGIASDSNVLAGKRLQLLKELAPSAERVTFLYDKDYADACRTEIGEIQKAAHKLGMKLQEVPYQGQSALDEAIARARQTRPQALFVPVGGMFSADMSKVGEFATGSSIPALIQPLEIVLEDKAVLFYGPDADWQARRAAEIMARILKGTKPADIPVERASRFELVVNLKAAKAMNLKVSESLLFQATRVIE
jgi:putative ABC transport system substrate-binding protein